MCITGEYELEVEEGTKAFATYTPLPPSWKGEGRYSPHYVLDCNMNFNTNQSSINQQMLQLGGVRIDMLWRNHVGNECSRNYVAQNGRSVAASKHVSAPLR